MHKGKTKYMTNFQNDQEIHIENEKTKEVTNYKYLGQTTYLKDTTKEEVTCTIRAGWTENSTKSNGEKDVESKIER